MGENLIAAPANLGELINILTQVVVFGTPFAILLLFFFWNMYQLIMTVDDAEKKKQARDRIVFGVLVLFVVFSIAGLVAILQATFFGEEAVSRNFNITPAPEYTPPVETPVQRDTPAGDGGQPPVDTDPDEELLCPGGERPPCTL
jgi:heme A synthase